MRKKLLISFLALGFVTTSLVSCDKKEQCSKEQCSKEQCSKEQCSKKEDCGKCVDSDIKDITTIEETTTHVEEAK